MTQDSHYGTWYQGGLSFQCTGCGDCCSGPHSGYVWIEDSEIEHLADHLGIEDMDLFEKRFVRTVGARRSLVEYSDGDCIFLDPKTRRCIVYSVRPTQCRTWPFWTSNLESPQSWSRASKSCPGCNQGRLYPLSEIHQILNQESDTSRS